MRNHRKQSPPANKPSWEAHSTYTADLGVPDRRQYRRTPPGSPTVADLVRPGDTVSTSYGTGGVAIEVKEYFYAAPIGETLSHFTIVYVRPGPAAKFRDIDRHWINECVAVGDRIPMLFEANTDEVFIVDRARSAETRPCRTLPHHLAASSIWTA
ncbi:hypothetical protein [Mesorhizobium sp. CN2-181]|uniref:hypothetical protein n=1 Tax=Mesorhizobium yinganensis TaxID=3157707 RepID=UPI0032B84B19